MTMRVMGIDTGPEASAYAVLEAGNVYPVVTESGKLENAQLLKLLDPGELRLNRLVVERISPRRRFVKLPTKLPKGGGVSVTGVGYDVLLACEWAGVYRGSFGLHCTSMVERADVCRYFTGSTADKPAVNDGIAALWRMGKRQATAKDGPLPGLTIERHTWDAAALALYWLLTHGWDVAPHAGVLVAAPTPTPRLVEAVPEGWPHP